MSDLQIIGIVGGVVILLFFIACARIGRRIGVHLNAPPRGSEKDFDKRVEDKVNAVLARRDAR